MSDAFFFTTLQAVARIWKENDKNFNGLKGYLNEND
jgi:hypothetical protein